MTLDEIVRLSFIELQEDYNFPNFWEWNRNSSIDSEIKQYAYEALREILKRTEINITERMIPLYTDTTTDPDTGEEIVRQYGGFYTPPVTDIMKIQSIYWKPLSRTTGEGENMIVHDYPLINLRVISLDEMDRMNPNWREATTEGNPSHAVLYSGNFNELHMGNGPNMRRNGIKIKLYPTPTNITDLNEAISELDQLDEYLNATRMSNMGGLMDSHGGNMVYGIDVNGDGVRDDVPIQGSTDLGILIRLFAGEIDDLGGGFPIIRYVPEVKKNIFTELVLADTGVQSRWYNLDNLLPYDLQLAMREYICYMAFRKEGEAQDKDKSKKYKELFDDIISEYRAENYLFRHEQKTFDANFILGYNSNKKGAINGIRKFI